MEDFRKDCIKEYAETISPDEVLKHLDKDQVLTYYTPEERLKGLSPDAIKEYLEKINSQE